MNYKKIYDSIIRNRQLNPYDGYVERHHIIPRSLGGSDDSDNIVALTAREHFVCHCLLAKMYPKESFEWYKMNHAFMMMKCDSMTQERYFNSRLYESLRGNFASVMSFAQRGQRNSQYGSMWICNVELQENKKITKTDDIPDGWIKGRSQWNNKKVCPTCGLEFYSTSSKQFCSKKCRPKFSQMDGREEEFLSLYDKHNSINVALKEMGFIGAGDYFYWAKKLVN